MFEGIVAYLLNKYLGKYVQDLDSEDLNVGIFHGTVELTDLRLKPEALFELGLPIEVKAGCVGKISVDIPWMSLYTDPVLIQMEDILILAGPITDRTYDPEREKQLMRAYKKKQLDEIQEATEVAELDKPRGFFENLVATIVNNVQVSLQNIHIRYEDTISTPVYPLSCGIILQSMTAITTNNKWKPIQIDTNASNIFKLLKIEALSVYWNAATDPECLIKNDVKTYRWKHLMKKGLEEFSVNGESFDFVVKPVSAKMKMIFNKSSENKVPKLLADFMLQDASAQFSRKQYLSFLQVIASFRLMNINRRYRKYSPDVPLKGNAKKWWHYAYKSVLEEYVHPRSWSRIKEHRERYRKYKMMYIQLLARPNDTELRLDLQLLEDQMDIANIIMAREEAKLMIAKDKPEQVQKKVVGQSWLSTLFSYGTEATKGEEIVEVLGEKEKSVWSRLSAEEKQKLCEAIGCLEDQPVTDTPVHYISHKINFTLANCTVSLFSYEREIMVVTLTQFLTSFEIRPSASAYKMSARAEGFVFEGASPENDLVPVITANTITSGSSFSHVFAFDLEKNPLHVKADYGLIVNVEPVEVVYQEHAISEIIAFFQVPSVSVSDMKKLASEKLQSIAQISQAGLEYAIKNHTTVHVNIDFKSPYFVIPEHGSVQKGGNFLIVDMGRLTVRSDLQSDDVSLEEYTRMEIEERLYDRFNIVLSDIQVLFTDSGEDWRTARMTPESELHLLPKVKIQTVFSNSVKPDYRQLPRQKVNVAVTSLKFNLSDRRIHLLSEFIHKLPLPDVKHADVPYDEVDAIELDRMQNVDVKDAILEATKEELEHIKTIFTKSLPIAQAPEKPSRSSTESSLPASEHYYSASDHSDEEPEIFARIVDLPGFDDNTSPHNTINILLRFMLGEVVILLARSSDHLDKPYLMFRVEKLCIDTAIMEYGPALQASLGSIQLVDKLHTRSSGEYLELLTTEGKTDMVTILYRKVRATCPEFKSHFHQVEQSLNFDLASISITFHREALMTLGRFLLYVLEKAKIEGFLSKPLISKISSPSMMILNEDKDPPIPPGATKFSISARISNVDIHLCDTDLQLARVKASGMNCDYILKANEKMIFRIDLTSLSVDDLTELTLYPKILAIEDDKVFDFKYVKNSTLHKAVGSDEEVSHVKNDGSLRLRVGRVNFVFLHRFVLEVQRFFEPFIRPNMGSQILRTAGKVVEEHVAEISKQGVRLGLSVEIHAPTILIPQKTSSANLLAFSLGELSIENFFKEVTVSGGSNHIVDNILIRLASLQMARAIILLDGTLERQEPIIEPMKIRLDVKRAVTPYHREILMYDISGNMDLIKINIGQKDLSTVIGIYYENLSEGPLLDSRTTASTPTSPAEVSTPVTVDDPVKKLAAFFSTSVEIYKETSISFTMEGLQLTLFMDVEEAVSSPVRDPSYALCKFELDEVAVSIEIYNDKALELKCSLQAADLEDVRPDSGLALTKIFQSYSGDAMLQVEGFSVSMPPMVDITYKQTGGGDASLDILIERTRFNMSVPFIMAVVKFIYDVLPDRAMNHSKSSEHIVHEALSDQDKNFVMTKLGHRRLPSDNTSGYHSTMSTSATEEIKGLSISAVLKKPEVILFTNPSSLDSHVLVLKMDVMTDYSRNMGQENIVVSVGGLHILSCVYSRRKQTMHMVLLPSDIEITKFRKIGEDEVKMTASLSTVDVRISSSTVQTVMDVVRELTSDLKEAMGAEKAPQHMNEDLDLLWEPKKIVPYKWSLAPEEEVVSLKPMYPTEKSKETFTLTVTDLKVTCELTEGHRRMPVFYFRAGLIMEISGWSKQISMRSDFQLESLYYNEKLSTWEPFIEPIMESENHYRPWEATVKIFRDQSHPIVCQSGCQDSILLSDAVDGDHLSLLSRAYSESSSSGDETDMSGDMVVIKRQTPISRPKRMSTQKSHDSGSIVSTCHPDSDSETEENVLEKLSNAFGHLFSDDSSEESSDSEVVADVEIKSDSGETETADNDISVEEQAYFMSSEKDAVDAVLEDRPDFTMATYFILQSKDKLEINVTPSAINILSELIEDFMGKPMSKIRSISLSSHSESLVLKNFLGPEATVTVLKKMEEDKGAETYVQVHSVPGKDMTSSPSSPTALRYSMDFSPVESDMETAADEEDAFSIYSSTLKIDEEKNFSPSAYMEKDATTIYNQATKERISIEVEGFDRLQCLMPQRASTFMYALQPVKNKMRYYLVVDANVYHGQKTVIVRSPLQVQNNLPRPVHIFCEKSNLESVKACVDDYAKNPFHDKYVRLETLDSGAVFNIPLLVAYHCKIFVQPMKTVADINDYEISTEGFWWQQVVTSPKHIKFLQCTGSKNEDKTFWIKAFCVENTTVKSPAVGTKLVPNYVIHLNPPLIIHNFLGYPMDITLKKTNDTYRLNEGEKLSLLHIHPQKPQEVTVEIPQYLGIPWHGKLEVAAQMEEYSTLLMEPELDTEGGNKHLGVCVHLEQEESLDLYLYSPYWIINKTGLPLQFRGQSSDVIYESTPSPDEPLLFRFKKHKKRKIKVRAYNSRWSKSFSIDTVGNNGVIVCLDSERNKKYRLFLNIQMSKLQLTKIVTIMPYFTVINRTQHFLRFMEENEQTDLWFDLAPGQCQPFWPCTESMKMFVKYRDSSIISQHFIINKHHTTVLRMDQGSALCVEVTGGVETPMIIGFYPYAPGDAPVRVENLCEDLFLKIHQKSQGQATLLSPYQSVLYTWDDPTVERTLIWNLYNRKKPGFPAQIYKDGYGMERLSFHSLKQSLINNSNSSSRERAAGQSSSDDDDSESETGVLLPRKTRKDKVVVYWVSLLDGQQRVLLFTQDERVAKQARRQINGEKALFECFTSLDGIGVSLINSAYQEVSHISVTSAPALWEVEINHKWKTLTLELSAWLEDKWQHEQQKAELKDYIQVEFSKMLMTKPFFGQLRRSYNPAVWLQMRMSKSQMYLHTKVHRIQVDNQLCDAVFPTVLYPVPIPPAILKHAFPKPFIEFGLLTHRSKDYSKFTVKYLKLIMQETNVKLDKGFLLSLYDMYSSLSKTEDEKIKMDADMTTVHKPLEEITSGPETVRTHRIVFEYIHLSPLKIHFSFSPRGMVHKSRPEPWTLKQDVLEFFLNSLGATLTEIKDVELRMLYFERTGAVVTPSQLLAEVKSHYLQQIIQQAYAIVLGLDVLGNPYGLIRDFTQGLGDFFYEPWLGSLTGSEEFAEGLAKGIQSLLEHIVGGTASSISLISGSVGQAASMLTFDEDYKKRRRQQIQQHPGSLPETLTIAAKSFVMGVVLGLSGVVTKPITGGLQEGVDGFFKGIGKGLMGLLTKPAVGVCDMVSMAFDGIQRAAEMGQDVVMRIRLPRYINPCQGVMPFSPYQARGYRLMLQLSKGHYAETDIYWAHAALSREERADIALVTDKHVFLLERCRFWGGWDVEWVVRVDDIMSVPVICGKHLVIKIRQDDSFANFTGDERYIQSEDKQVLEWLKEKIEKVLLVNMEDKPCPSLV